MSAKAIGKRLRKLRGTTSQVAFAARIGVAQSTISRVEKGKWTLDTEAAVRACAAYKADLTWLLTGYGVGP